MMIQKRCGAILLRIVITPFQLAAVIITLLVSTIILSEIFLERDDGLVELKKYDKQLRVFQYRPTLKTLDVEKTKDCPIFQLKANIETPVRNMTPVTCKRLRPVAGSCDTAKEIFLSHQPANCSGQQHYQFCRLQRTELKLWNVLCDSKAAQICKVSLSLGLPSQKTGELDWEDFQNIIPLEAKLKRILQDHDSANVPQHYGFVFIRCQWLTNNYTEYDDYYHYEDYRAEQLLILPPFIKNLKPKQQTPSNFHDLNLNIVLVDSLSRQHLFRSLPKTVSALEEIPSQPVANVFDFELFQAIKSRTFETLQVVFSGSVNVTETPFGTHDMPSKPLNLAPIFKTLQKRGYKTLWLEDLCYLWEWGISKDLHFLNLDSTPKETWNRMWSALEKNGVDSIDATLSMCRVLKANEVNDHFHGPEAVCFNGKHQHEYLLDYLKLYQEEMKAIKQPFLTMTSTNVGHEDTGKRIQTLDSALADYISYTASLENTISVIFSDHGNAYGKFLKESNEALIELYQPFMFFVIPRTAASLLGSDVMTNLRLNTKRLVSALDLHYTLKHVASLTSAGQIQAPSQQFPVSEKGLFHPVDPERTCNTVPRVRPNVCICENFHVPLEPSSFASLFGYFSVGAINDEIQRQYRKLLVDSPQITAFGSCQPLYLDKVTDIKQTTGSDGQKLFQMNIHVQKAQVFFISIVLTYNKQGKPHTFLETVSRITPYSIYKNCSDATVKLSLCICNLSVQNKISESGQKFSLSKNSFEKLKMNIFPFLEIVVTPLKTNPCLYVFTLKHKDGAAILSVNECQNIYTLKAKIKSHRKFIYFQRAGEMLLLPGGVGLLGLVVSEKGKTWSCSIDTDFHLVKHLKE